MSCRRGKPPSLYDWFLELDRYRYTNTDTNISVSVRRIFKPTSPISPIPNRYRYICMIPIYLYNTDTDIYYKDIALKNRYHTDIPIPISPKSPIPNRYRYRYPKYPPCLTDIDTRFIPIFFIQIPMLGIGISAHTGYRSNSSATIEGLIGIQNLP